MIACAGGHLDMARWLVADAGCDLRSKSDRVRRLCECGAVCDVRVRLFGHVGVLS